MGVAEGGDYLESPRGSNADEEQVVDSRSTRDEAPGMREIKLAVASVLLLTSVSAQAALKLTYERKKAGDTGAPGVGTITADAEHVRIEGLAAGRAAGRGGTVILDGAGKKMLMLEPEKKAYREMTEADFQKMKEQRDSMRAQMAERLKTMPPERRKQAEEMMSRFGGGPNGPDLDIKYTPLGTKKKVNGFACEMYKVEMGPRTGSEACYSPWTSGLITKAEVAQFKKLSAELEKTFGVMGAAAQWGKAPGVAVEQTFYGPDGKTVEWTHTLKSVTRTDVPAAEFQVPAGYTKEESPMMGRGMGRGPGGPGGPGGHHGPGGAPATP
jgi:hypothetical protein